MQLLGEFSGGVIRYDEDKVPYSSSSYATILTFVRFSLPPKLAQLSVLGRSVNEYQRQLEVNLQWNCGPFKKNEGLLCFYHYRNYRRAHLLLEPENDLALTIFLN